MTIAEIFCEVIVRAMMCGPRIEDPSLTMTSASPIFAGGRCVFCCVCALFIFWQRFAMNLVSMGKWYCICSGETQCSDNLISN